jgi:hypothetical protein
MSWGGRIHLGLLPWRLRFTHRGGATVLPRLAYLTLCRSIQLLAQLARGDAAKDLRRFRDCARNRWPLTGQFQVAGG